MQRFEYKVVSLEDGRYTEALNEYARDGWELQSVVPDVHEVAPPSAEKRRSLPMPGALGLAADAASTLGKLEGGSKPDYSQPGTTAPLPVTCVVTSGGLPPYMIAPLPGMDASRLSVAVTTTRPEPATAACTAPAVSSLSSASPEPGTETSRRSTVPDMRMTPLPGS